MSLFFSLSPVPVPAEPSGLPGAACGWLPLLLRGRTGSTGPPVPWRAGNGGDFWTDEDSQSEAGTLRSGVSERQSGRKPFPCRPDHRSRVVCDAEPAALRPSAAACRRHVSQMRTCWSHQAQVYFHPSTPVFLWEKGFYSLLTFPVDNSCMFFASIW